MSDTQPPAGHDPAPRRSLRLLRGALLVLGAAVLVIGVLAGAAYLRMSQGALTLPDIVTTRLEAAIDRATDGADLTLGDLMVEVLEDGTVQVALSDVVIRDGAGRLLAALPLVETDLSGAALRRGTVKPVRVTLAGAGVVLRQRDDGTLNVRVAQDEDAPSLALTEGLAWIDDVFDAPELDRLESLEGRALTVLLARDGQADTLRITDAAMRLTRQDDTLAITMGGVLQGETETPIDLAMTRRAGSGQTDLAGSFRDLAARDLAQLIPALTWLDLVDAPIAGQIFTPLGDDGRLGDFSGQLVVGAGQFDIEGIGAPLSFESMVFETRYSAPDNRLWFDRLYLDAPELGFEATGHADLSADGRTYVGQFALEDIVTNPRGIYPASVALESAAVDLRLSLGAATELEIGHAVIVDDGAEMTLQADLRASAEGLTAVLDAHVARIEAGQVLSYWPRTLGSNARRWLGENLFSGTLHEADFALRLGVDGDLLHEVQFDFTGAEIRPLRDVPPITGGAGLLRFAQENLQVRLDAGRIAGPGGGPVDLAGTTMAIPYTGMRGPDTRISVAAEGGLGDVLTLLTLPPVSLFAEGDLTPEAVGTGQVTARADLGLRLVRPLTLPEVEMDATGTVTGFASTGLVPGRQLEADILALAVDNRAVRVSGDARLDGVPLSGEWTREIGPGADPVSRIAAEALLDRDALARFGVRLPQAMLGGQTRADIDLTLPPGEPGLLRLRSDLAGLTLAIPELGWRLGRETTGALEAEIMLGPDPAIPALTLEAGGLSLSGRVDLTPDGGLTRLVADRLRIGSWLDVAGSLSPRGAGAAPAIRVTGGTVDLRRMPELGSGGGGASAPIDLTLDRVQIVDGIALTDVQAEIIEGPGLNGRFGGRVNGQAPLRGIITPGATGPAVRVLSDDGGAVLRAAGIFRTAHGGDMELTLVSLEPRGHLDGQLTIQGPRLRDAPAMAELLNAISVVGLLEQLDGQGINLGLVEARFRITPDQVVLSRGSAIGPSMGVSMDGTYQTASRQIDMQGVISPFYALNGLLGVLTSPRREGLFGFAYRLQGVGDATTVTVNPLSIFTPGVFREIFRRPPPELSRAE